MRRIKKKLQRYTKVVMCLTLSIVIAFSCVCISFASVRIKGFGVYRQGNAPNPSGHAGLVYAQNISVNEPIIHVAQDEGQLVHRAGLTTFQDGQDFYGYYVPKTFKDLSATEKVTKMDSVIAIADDFLGLSIDTLSYNLIFQIWYSVDLNGNGKVDPAEITSMRCDGLVEYAYEYDGFSVYGGNISIFDTEIRNDHGAPNVTLKQ